MLIAMKRIISTGTVQGISHIEDDKKVLGLTVDEHGNVNPFVNA
jgi:hypothetical protein